MKKKSSVIGALAVAASLILAACGGSSDSATSEETTSAASGEPIIIGVNLDSTGPGAAYSTVAGKTIEDTVAKINAEGGVLGRPIELIYGNDESDPTKSPSVVRKLIDDGAVAIILQTATAAATQAKPVLEEAKIVGIAPTAISQTIALPPDNTYSYMIAAPINSFVDVYCSAFEFMGWKKLAFLSDATPTIDGVNSLLIPGLSECIEIVAEEKAPVDATDVSAQVARIKAKNPDAVYVSSVGGTWQVLAINTVRQQMPDVQLLDTSAIGNQPANWPLANPGALDGLLFMGALNFDNPKTAELRDWLKSLRGDDYVMSAYDAQGYDAVMLLKEAIERAGSDDPAAIHEAMNQTDYEASFGNAGFRITFTPDKHIGATGLCGVVITKFGSDNKVSGPWDLFQPPCD